MIEFEHVNQCGGIFVTLNDNESERVDKSGIPSDGVSDATWKNVRLTFFVHRSNA
jgi:hypothetical protein